MLGEAQFLMNTINSRKITAKKLCTAFGVRPPAFLEGAPDKAYYILLQLGITRELQKRQKLLQHNTIDDVVRLLEQSKNIMVITGAGVSSFTYNVVTIRSHILDFYEPWNTRF